MNSNLSDMANAITLSLATTGVSQMTGQILGASGNAATPSYAFASDTATGFYLAGAHQIGIATNGNLLATFNSDQSVNWTSTQTAPAFNTTSGGVIMPVGSISFYAGTTAPSGWQLCFGQQISRTTYAALFNVIGTTYGIGNGSTTFQLPDCRGCALAGRDNMGGNPANRIGTGLITDGGTLNGQVLGSIGGSQTHVQSPFELASHGHSGSGNVSDPGHAHNFALNTVIGGGAGTIPVGSNAGPNTTTGNAVLGAGTGITVPSLNINPTGSSAAMAWLQPTIIVNVIIFSGVP